MTTDAFTTAAYAVALHRNGPGATFREALTGDPITSFLAGAVWARDHLARQEPTDAEVEAAAIMLCASAHHERVWEALADVDPWKQEAIRADARAALTAAKEARA